MGKARLEDIAGVEPASRKASMADVVSVESPQKTAALSDLATPPAEHLPSAAEFDAAHAQHVAGVMDGIQGLAELGGKLPAMPSPPIPFELHSDQQQAREVNEAIASYPKDGRFAGAQAVVTNQGNAVMPGTPAPADLANLAIAGGLAGVTSLAAGGNASVAQGAKLANFAVSTYFGTQAGLHAVKSIPEAYDLYKQGDYWGAVGKLGQAGTSAVLAVMAGLHAKGQIKGAADIASAKRVLQEHLNAQEAARRMQETGPARLPAPEEAPIGEELAPRENVPEAPAAAEPAAGPEVSGRAPIADVVSVEPPQRGPQTEVAARPIEELVQDPEFQKLPEGEQLAAIRGAAVAPRETAPEAAPHPAETEEEPNALRVPWEERTGAPTTDELAQHFASQNPESPATAEEIRAGAELAIERHNAENPEAVSGEAASGQQSAVSPAGGEEPGGADVAAVESAAVDGAGDRQANVEAAGAAAAPDDAGGGGDAGGAAEGEGENVEPQGVAARRPDQLVEGRRKNLSADVLGGPEYRGEAPLHHKVGESRVRILSEPGHPPTVLVNRQAYAAIHEAVMPGFSGDIDEGPHTSQAVTLSAGAVRDALRGLRAMASRPEMKAAVLKLARIEQHLRQASSDESGRGGQRPAIVFNPHPDMEPADWQDILTEERNHVLQLSVNGTFNLLGEAGTGRLIEAAPAAAARLREIGYKEPVEISAEIGERLLSGGLKGIGVSDADAGNVADLYSTLLREHNGAKANDLIRKIAERFPGRGIEPAAELPRQGRQNPGRRGPLAEARRQIEPRPEAGRRRDRAEVKPLGSERGSLPFSKDPNQPESNYSGLGAQQDIYVRNLSQLEKANPAAHAAAVRAASTRAQTAVLVRAAVPAIERALGKDGPSWNDLRASIIESRLRGIRERWQAWSKQAETWTPKQIQAQAEDGSLLGLLKSIQGKQGIPADVVDTAAALLSQAAQGELVQAKPGGPAKPILSEGPALAELRAFLGRTFEDAGNHVARMMPEKDFDRITKGAAFARGLAVYKKLLETPIAANHALNEGVFTNALGPLQTYYPLIPMTAAEANTVKVLGHSITYRKPRNLANQQATGLAAGYDTSMEPFRERLNRAMAGNNRAALIQTLEDQGLIHVLGEGEFVPDSFDYQGRQYEATEITVGGGRQVVKGGQPVQVRERGAVMPKWLAKELKPVLEKGDYSPGMARKLIGAVNTVQMLGPLDLGYHAKNILGTLVSNTPFLPLPNAPLTALGNVPVVKAIHAVLRVLTTSSTDAAAVRDLTEMAKLGAVHPRFASASYSKKFAEATGGERELGTGPLLYGPQGLDVKARLVMYRVGKSLYPQATPAEMTKWVNQLGNYTQAMQGAIERAAKQTGLSPFITAGMTMNRNAVNALVGNSPIKSRPAWHRAAQLGNALGAMAAIYVIANLWYRGKLPWEEKGSRLNKLKLKPEDRNSWLGKKLYGDAPGEAYVDLNFWNPLVERGLRATGIDAAYNTRMLGGDAKQMAMAAAVQTTNSLSHPFLGPAAQAGALAVTRHETALRSFEPFETYKAKSRWEALRVINRFLVDGAEATGIGEPADRRYAEGDKLMQIAASMAGITGQPARNSRHSAALATERVNRGRRLTKGR